MTEKETERENFEYQVFLILKLTHTLQKAKSKGFSLMNNLTFAN